MTHIVRIQVIKTGIKFTVKYYLSTSHAEFFSKTDLSQIISNNYSFLWWSTSVTAVLTLFNQ